MIEISLYKLNDHAFSPLQFHFLHKIYLNALPFEHGALGGHGKLWTKKYFYDQTFIKMGMTSYKL